MNAVHFWIPPLVLAKYTSLAVPERVARLTGNLKIHLDDYGVNQARVTKCLR
jgi:hypothetical protein